jgi:regulator of sigma E protease
LGESIGQVDVVVRRQNKDVTLTDVPLRPVDRFETPLSRSSSMSLPTLGIAYGVTNEVRGIVPDSPAAKTSLKSGDMITSATILPPEEQPPEAKQRKVELDFAPGKDTWPLLLEALQQALPGSLVKLERPGDTPITLDPVAAPEWTDPRRGFHFEAKTFLMKASSPGEAVAMGSTEATNSLMMVVRFLRKLGTQVSPKAISGPVGIAHLAYQIASQGLSEFLLFITMISANLAVVNFLPIPVLDGGHMVFLAYEGLRGKPPSERLQVGLSYVGLLLLLSLMLYASGLDLHLISRN